MNVLLIEDDDGVREVMADLLADSARVLPLQTLNEGLKALEKQPFDLVIADLRLRGAADGGRQMIAAARKRLVPVVIMTGLQGDEMQRALGGTPPDAVLLKPFAIEEATATCNRFGRLWRELSQRAGATPGPAWEEFSAGVRVQGQRSSPQWLELAPGARSPLSFSAAHGCQVIEGQLSIYGEELSTGRSFFLSAGQPYELSAAQASRIALVSLPTPG